MTVRDTTPAGKRCTGIKMKEMEGFIREQEKDMASAYELNIHLRYDEVIHMLLDEN